jgi:hypothetical protein
MEDIKVDFKQEREVHGQDLFCHSINNPIKHSYFYHKNNSVFTKICYMFQPVSLSSDEAL